MCFTRWFLSSLPIKFAMVLIIWKQLAISSQHKMSSLLILPSMPFLVNSLTGSLILVPLIISPLILPIQPLPTNIVILIIFVLAMVKPSSFLTSVPHQNPFFFFLFYFLNIFIFSMFYSIHYKILPSIHQFCKDKGFFFNILLL